MKRNFYVVASVLASILFLTLTCYAEAATGYVDVTLAPSTLLGDVYVDGALLAAQVNTAHLPVTPGTPHVIEVKNVVDPAPGFGDVFVYGEISRPNVTVGEGYTYGLTVWPSITYRKGYVKFSCDTRQREASQNVACQARIGEAVLGTVNPAETVQWAIPIGKHTLHVDLVGEHAGLWAPPASEHPVTIWGGQTTYLRAAYDRKGQLTISPSVTGIVGDLYVDEQLVAAQVASATLFVEPGNHTVAGRNWIDPAANGVYRYADSASTVWVGANQTRAAVLYPQKEYLLGFGQVACSIAAVAAGQDVRCNVTIDGHGMGTIEAGQSKTYNLAPGAHAVNVSVVGGNADLWSPAVQDASLVIYAGSTNRVSATFNRKGQLTISPSVTGIVGDLYVDEQLVAAQAAEATLFVAPGNHTIAGRNWIDPAANGVYRYADSTSTVWVGANQARAAVLYPQKEYLLGFGQVACSITAVTAGQDVRCNVTIDGHGMGTIEAGQNKSYNLAPGAHAVNVNVVGGNASMWTPSTRSGSLTIAAARTSYLTASFNRSSPNPVSSRPARVDTGSFELGGHITSFGNADKMHYAGMSWAKVQVHYGDDVAGLVADAHAKDFKIQLSALGAPDMVTKSDFAAKFSAWTAQLAASGADAIEVWNEPNIDREWQKGHISPASYTQLLCAAYRAIKKANPSTLVISAAPSPTGYFGGCSGDGCDDNYWVAGLRDAGAARCMDYVGAHHNAGATSPSARSGHPAGTHYSWYFLPQTELYYRTLRKKLFYTEMGYVSPVGYCQIPNDFAWGAATTLEQQAQWLAEAASLSARTGMVRVLIVWNVNFSRYDCGPGPGDPQAGYAIIRPDGSCPACETLHAVLGTR